MLKLKLPILWPPDSKSRLTGKEPTHWKRPDSLEKTLMLGRIEGRRRRGRQRMKWLGDVTDSTVVNLSKLWEVVKDREA